jgi:hypothetical protein
MSPRQHHRRKRQQVEHPRRDEPGYLARFGSGAAGPLAEAYRIAGYADGLVGAAPACAVLKPHYDSGLKWADANNPQPEDPLWGAGVRAGLTWDGTFYRDRARYPAGGALFWCAYFKPGSGPGLKNGYWFNFGSGWSHLHNDQPAALLAGAAQKLFFDPVTNQWTLVIEATQFVTHAVVNVWTGTKSGGNDPTGSYTRTAGLDPLAALTIAAL